METVGAASLWSFSSLEEQIGRTSNTKIRQDPGFRVDSYMALVQRVSEIQFRNRDYVLLFRGQGKDYQNKQRTSSLRPSLLRSGANTGYEKLARAESLLADRYRFTGRDRIRKHQALRWSIIQHYGVCGTPLLDVTQSLRIAASFASHVSEGNEAYVFVLAVPNISGAITASDEAGLEIIRLSSVCPPEAVRPHIQEGYLLSEFPELSNLQQHAHYENHELDFAKRIIAKFRFRPDTFWESSQGFPMIPHKALYPDRHDPLLDLMDEIKFEVENL